MKRKNIIAAVITVMTVLFLVSCAGSYQCTSKPLGKGMNMYKR